MLLRFEDSNPFAQGASSYGSRPATERESTPRIFLGVQIGHIPTEAVLDTGAVYLVCNPEIAGLLNLDPADALELEAVEIRGRRIDGSLHRVYLTFLADLGEDLTIDATAFVPRLDPDEPWPLPSFMGLFCCLERVRFAVDPVTDTFSFGSIDEGDDSHA